MKIDYLVLDAKLLLINMNYIEFFYFLKFYRQKKFLTKFVIVVDVADL